MARAKCCGSCGKGVTETVSVVINDITYCKNCFALLNAYAPKEPAVDTSKLPVCTCCRQSVFCEDQRWDALSKLRCNYCYNNCSINGPCRKLNPDIPGPRPPEVTVTDTKLCAVCGKEVAGRDQFAYGSVRFCKTCFKEAPASCPPLVDVPQSSPTNTTQFDTALAGLVNTERGAVYGHPLDNFQRISALQAVVADCTDPELRVALDNICAKLARLVQSPKHLDSWIDIAGYARCAVMILDERAGRAAK